MTAAAGSARAADHLAGAGAASAAGLAVVVAGGVVEGVALGVLQGRSLPVPGTATAVRRRWLAATTLVAGLGWAAASAPAALANGTANGTAEGQPPLALLLLAAAALGAVLGLLLGAAQAWAVRPAVRHPRRWLGGSAAGWTVAMPMIFLGATSAGADWPLPLVLGYGALTGAVAGTALGLVTAPFVTALDGPAPWHRAIAGVVGVVGRRRWTGHGPVVLTVVGARTGRAFRFPVLAVTTGTGALVVLPGGAERKRWWRNLLDGRATVLVERGGQETRCAARVLRAGDEGWEPARTAYEAAYRRVRVAPTDPLVLLEPRADALGRQLP